MTVYFSVRSKFGKEIRTTKTYWTKIVTLKHPVMIGKEDIVKNTLIDPDYIVETEHDTFVCTYYKLYSKRYICVVVRHENGTGFIITTYPADVVKKGKRVYEKTKKAQAVS